MSIADAAVIGASRTGLSIAAYLRTRDLNVRVFGRPMETWREHMPKGMHLKSEGFASQLFDPDGKLTLANFCSAAGIGYADVGLPVALATFCDYGVAFRKKVRARFGRSRSDRRRAGGRPFYADAGRRRNRRRAARHRRRRHQSFCLRAAGIGNTAARARDAQFALSRLRALQRRTRRRRRSRSLCRRRCRFVAQEAGAFPSLVARTAKLAFYEPLS